MQSCNLPLGKEKYNSQLQFSSRNGYTLNQTKRRHITHVKSCPMYFLRCISLSTNSINHNTYNIGDWEIFPPRVLLSFSPSISIEVSDLRKTAQNTTKEFLDTAGQLNNEIELVFFAFACLHSHSHNLRTRRMRCFVYLIWNEAT